MNILGISAFYHDSAAALLCSGSLVAAAQEERFTRRKHDRAFPGNAVGYCLKVAGLRIEDIDRVVYHESPARKFRRVLKTALAFAPHGLGNVLHTLPSWFGEKLHRRRDIVAGLTAFGRFDAGRLHCTEHHRSHAAAAFFPSPFEQAAILVVDGVGESATTSIGNGSGSVLRLERQLHFPHSLGLLYAAFTAHLGFRVNGGEYKLMGLAPYGRPVYAERILDRIVDLKPDGSFRLDQRYFDYCIGASMTSAAFEELFGIPRRTPESTLEQGHCDLAASIQQVTEQILLAVTRALARTDTSGNLCLGGGVALNCVANRRILADGGFRHVWVQPAAGDAGNALGAALVGHHLLDAAPRRLAPDRDAMQGSYLGPAFTAEEGAARLAAAGAHFTRLPEPELLARSAELLDGGRILGWFQGRMEFGPRALGNRSILADPRDPAMQRKLNLQIKFRESFRPFAPAVLAEDALAWFELDRASPYMLLVADVRPEHRLVPTAGTGGMEGVEAIRIPRSTIPAVTHVDHSARVQTVHADTNPLFHRLLGAFRARTGCPVLVNTSFNVRGEPIVCTPEDAFACFVDTGMDALVLGDCLLLKHEQSVVPAARRFELD